MNEIADTIEEGIKLTNDVPSLHENGMMTVLDIQAYVTINSDGKQQVIHTFYKKDVASKFAIIYRSAISKQCKRSTNVQEGLRRLRNTSESLPWSEKARILSKFSHMLYISGYSEKYRFNVIKGVILRHKELLNKVKSGEIESLYRNRDAIIAMKEQKGGNSSNTWFITNETNNILMTTATPNSELAIKLRETLNNQPMLANGRTKPIEKGGLPTSLGLKMKDPFKQDGCDFGDETCPIIESQACSTVGSCYRAICECSETNDNLSPNETDIFNYVGTSGTSAHNRHKSHIDAVKRKSKTSGISQHMMDHHPNEEKIYKVKILSTHLSNLERVTSEMLWIEKQNPAFSMNRKAGDGSWSHSNLVRLITT